MTKPKPKPKLKPEDENEPPLEHAALLRTGFANATRNLQEAPPHERAFWQKAVASWTAKMERHRELQELLDKPKNR